MTLNGAPTVGDIITFSSWSNATWNIQAGADSAFLLISDGLITAYNAIIVPNNSVTSFSVSLICVSHVGSFIQWNIQSSTCGWQWNNQSLCISQLNDLSDIAISLPLNKQGLLYNSIASKWENSTIFNSISQTYTVYVDKSGSDTALNGAINNPYLTISYAMSQITFATSSQRVQIRVSSGDYTNNFSIKANVAIIGSNSVTTRIEGNIDLNDTSWNNSNDNRSSFQNITIGLATTLDFTTQSSTAGKLYFYGCRFNNTLTLIGYNAINQVECDYSVFFNGYNQTACDNYFSSCSFYGGTIQLNSSTLAGNPTILTFYGGGTEANIISTYISTNTVTLTLLSFGIQGTLSISGSQSILYATADSIPLNGVSVASGAILNYLNDSNALQYSCTNTAKWATPHVMSLQSALDRIANVVGATIPIP